MGGGGGQKIMCVARIYRVAQRKKTGTTYFPQYVDAITGISV